MRLHVICRGNVLRSLIAETYLRSFQLPNIIVASSGTNVDLESKAERRFFANTIALFKRHGIEAYAKNTSHQLTQERADGHDMTICMNQRVVDAALTIVSLPEGTLNWGIVDIGEGHRTNVADTRMYEEEIFREIVEMIDELVEQLIIKESRSR